LVSLNSRLESNKEDADNKDEEKVECREIRAALLPPTQTNMPFWSNQNAILVKPECHFGQTRMTNQKAAAPHHATERQPKVHCKSGP